MITILHQPEPMAPVSHIRVTDDSLQERDLLCRTEEPRDDEDSFDLYGYLLRVLDCRAEL